LKVPLRHPTPPLPFLSVLRLPTFLFLVFNGSFSPGLLTAPVSLALCLCDLAINADFPMIYGHWEFPLFCCLIFFKSRTFFPFVYLPVVFCDDGILVFSFLDSFREETR